MEIENFSECSYNPRDKEKNIRNYEDRMFSILCASFSIEDLPETVSERRLKKILLNSGSAVLKNIREEDFSNQSKIRIPGYYAFDADFGGTLDINKEPSLAIITDPNLNKSFESEIGKDCILIRANSAMSPVRFICERYARMMVENDISIYMTDVNLRAMNIFASADDRTRESAERFYKKLEDGDPFAVQDKEIFGSLKVLPYLGTGTNQVITNLIELQQYLRAGWFNDVGLSANYNMKREAINTEEAQLDSDSLLPYMDDMIDSINEGLTDLNKNTGRNSRAVLKSAWRERREEPKEEGGETDEDQGSDPESMG